MRRPPTSTELSYAVLGGGAAGLAAAFAMNAFQAAVEHFTSDDGQESAGEPATEQAADRVAAAVGTVLTDEDRATAGNAVHYALGAVLGAGYAVARCYEPRVVAGRGAGFGVATAAVLDEVAVPAAGLSAAPWTFPVSTHVFGLASHIIFGMTTDAVLRLLPRR